MANDRKRRRGGKRRRESRNPADPVAEVMRRLTDAALPYGFRVVDAEGTVLPDLVFFRPGGGPEVARLRYFGDGTSVLQSIIPHYVSLDEQLEVEAHLMARVAPVIRSMLAYPVWARLVGR